MAFSFLFFIVFSWFLMVLQPLLKDFELQVLIGEMSGTALSWRDADEAVQVSDWRSRGCGARDPVALHLGR